MKWQNGLRKSFDFAVRKLSWLLALLAAALIAVVIIATGPSAAPAEKVETAWPVSVVTARPDSLAPVLLAFGRLESRQVANLNTSISAPVKEVHRHEGEWVEAGELLIELDAAEPQLAYDIALASYQRNVAQLESVKTEQQLANSLVAEYRQLKDIAETRLQRIRDLHAQGMVADSELDGARQEASEKAIQVEEHLARVADYPNRVAQQQASVDEAAAYLEKARIDLQQTRIEAPFSGRVISTAVTRGDRVIAGSSLVQIADYSNLEIRTSIPAGSATVLRDIVTNGGTVTATAQLDNRKLSFPLVRLAADVKPGQSGIDAFFASDANDSLDIGRTVQLAITLPEIDRVIPMPVHALYPDQTLYRVVEDRLRAVHYQEMGDYLDIDGNFNVLVRSQEVSSGDLLMVSQLPRAITGLLVDPTEASDTETLLLN
ncbi:MAG: HlyD family efflux transporter periplasmic adaptor subunit [Pseudomonadales bacterium]|nr:HlyD family efflux transporter periplasmic adaptor subunit [Pseudomonadales bacterium]